MDIFKKKKKKAKQLFKRYVENIKGAIFSIFWYQNLLILCHVKHQLKEHKGCMTKFNFREQSQKLGPDFKKKIKQKI